MNGVSIRQLVEFRMMGLNNILLVPLVVDMLIDTLDGGFLDTFRTHKSDFLRSNQTNEEIDRERK